jgi:hypothetical protein
MGNINMPMPAMAMMPFHSAIGFDMLWFQSWMPMYLGHSLSPLLMMLTQWVTERLDQLSVLV